MSLRNFDFTTERRYGAGERVVMCKKGQTPSEARVEWELIYDRGVPPVFIPYVGEGKGDE